LTLEAFTSFLVSQMPKIRKSQIKTLAALVFGLFRADNISAAAIARKMCGLVDDKHKIKRVDRFMGNKRIDILAMAGALFNMLIARLPEKSRLLVALDWTDMHDETPDPGAGRHLLRQSGCSPQHRDRIWGMAFI